MCQESQLNPSHAKGMDRKKRTPQNEPEFIITPDMFDFDADLTSGSRQPIIHCYELGARYLLGFRYPTSEYLQAVIDYTTRRYWHRMTGNIEAMLWELDQGTIYGDKSVISTTTITTWELTQQGSKAAVDELISSLLLPASLLAHESDTLDDDRLCSWCRYRYVERINLVVTLSFCLV